MEYQPHATDRCQNNNQVLTQPDVEEASATGAKLRWFSWNHVLPKYCVPNFWRIREKLSGNRVLDAKEHFKLCSIRGDHSEHMQKAMLIYAMIATMFAFQTMVKKKSVEISAYFKIVAPLSKTHRPARAHGLLSKPSRSEPQNLKAPPQPDLDSTTVSCLPIQLSRLQCTSIKLLLQLFPAAPSTAPSVTSLPKIQKTSQPAIQLQGNACMHAHYAPANPRMYLPSHQRHPFCVRGKGCPRYSDFSIPSMGVPCSWSDSHPVMCLRFHACAIIPCHPIICDMQYD